MKSYLKRLLKTLPGVKNMLAERDVMLAERDVMLAERDAMLAERDAMLEKHNATFQKLRLIPINEARLQHTPPPFDSIDDTPWEHPFLTTGNIKRFREYTDAVKSFAHDYLADWHFNTPLSCAFCINLAQNMYKWGKLAQKYGAQVELFMNPHDETSLSDPCWEEFDGEYPDWLDGKGFKLRYPNIRPEISCLVVPMNGEGQWYNLNLFASGNRKPLLRQLTGSLGIRHEPLMAYQGVHPYFAFARRLSSFDVVYCASIPIAAYVSGKPYCYFAVGGDLQWDCGRGDTYGEIMSLAVNAARFLMISNPHALGHSRRLGFTNGIHLPYPMDSELYSPGQARYRQEWKDRFGGEVYILTTSRIDSEAKGFNEIFLKTIMDVSRQRPESRFIFLAWGAHTEIFKKRIAQAGMDHQLIVLMPVGKKRLIEYYRSCDIVLDQLVYGYFGATALEAASIGKPVIMKLHKDQYEPLYAGDLPPIVNVEAPKDLHPILLSMIDNKDHRSRIGQLTRNWLIRHHGEDRTVPDLLALLRLSSDHIPVPAEVLKLNPLLDVETEEESDYHRIKMRKTVHD